MTSREVAIVGIGCRLPGGIKTPNEFAEFLRKHGDAVVDVPADRWSTDLHHDPDPHAPGKTHVRRAAFLKEDIFSFDPDPFGISSKEADQLDPQQRLLLEVTWEALEDGGVPVDRVRGSNTAVFIGGFTLDRQTISHEPQNRRMIGTHTAFGSSMTLLSNRISYTFDLRGPSVTVDTACSSSLVATHLGYESVARGECDMAIVGGVNVMLSPAIMVVMSKAQFLAADGRSKTFDARADGYGRGEGAAVVILKPLEQALRDRDRIYSVIAATGINQDGRTLGISMPSEDAQRSLCERVLQASNLQARDIGYVEAHGTGTRAGDPIEVRALAQVYGRDREEPLLVGSVKTNVGHLEAAAGVTGLVKAALSVHLREIFPLRTIESLNPDIPFEQLNVEVARRSQAWPNDRVACVAVNSFGYGGTNAHAIVSEGPTQAESLDEDRDLAPTSTSLRVVPISAASREALLAQAAQLADAITDEDWEDQAFTLARRRAHLPERAAVLASSAEELREELQKVAGEEWGDERPVGQASGERRVLWVFTGMGPQWWGMGQELYGSEPVFRQAVVDADRAFHSIAGWSPLAEMLQDELHSRMKSNELAQPANFILQVGLVALLRDLGVPEHGLLGHSVGEVTAAWAAGCLSLRDAAFIACHRSRLQQKVAGEGTMLAVALSESQLQQFVSRDHHVAVAAYNAPKSLTLSGSPADLDDIARRLSAEAIFNRFVPVEVAYHSHHMDPLETDFRSVLGEVDPRRPERVLYSTTRGARLTHASHNGHYWWENARRPVLLQPALENAIAEGYTAFVEIGPHPVLASSIREVVKLQGTEARTFFCLKRGQGEARTIRQLIGGLYASGVSLDWERLYPQGRLSDLPKYPFCKRPHWVESNASRESRLGRPDRRFSEREDGPTLRLECDLAQPNVSYLAEHRIQEAVVLPAAAYIDFALAACREMNAGRSEYVVEDLRFERPLVLRAHAAPRLRVDLNRADGVLRMYARHEEQAWEFHARGRSLEESLYAGLKRMDLDRLKADLVERIDLDEAYRRFERLGLQYGPAFRGLRSLQYCANPAGGLTLLARVDVDSEPKALGGVHPVRIDSAFQAILAAARDVTRAMVPVSAERVRWFPGTGLASWAHAQVRPLPNGTIGSDLVLFAGDGSPVLEVRGLVCRALDGQLAREAQESIDLYHLDAWRPRDWPTPSLSRAQVWGLTGSASSFLSSLEAALHRRGIATRRADRLDRAAIDESSHIVFATSPDDTDPVGLAACERLRQLVQLLGSSPRKLRVVTFGAHKVEENDLPNPSQAALWGFSRVVMTEQPELACRLIDVPHRPWRFGSEMIDALNDEAVPEETAVRSEALYVHRVRRATQAEMSGPPRLLPAAEYEGAFAMQTAPGTESTRLVPRSRVAPGEDEVEVDVLCQSLGACDGSEPSMASNRGASLDLKAALQPNLRSVVGTVLRVGPHVSRVRPGDTIHVLQKCEATSHVTVHENRTVSLSKGHTPPEAVAYADFFLAWHALRDLARVERGDQVLISDAGSPIGAACVQVAALMGARIFATASERDRQRLGASPHAIYSSDTLDFVDAVRRDTDGKGLQVVINTVADPARLKSAELLGTNGRFIELNALSYEGPEGLEPPRLRRGQSFSVADLDSFAEQHPQAYQRLAEQVLAAFAENRLVLPVAHAIGARDAALTPSALHGDVSAARWALDLRAKDAMIDMAGVAHLPRSDRTYLVTGGLGGFGLATAQWLVEHGAGTVVLASRRGQPGPEAVEALHRMGAMGARVECRQLDVADEASVEEVLRLIRLELPPLAGVFHSAMVLDDHSVQTMSADSLRRVMLAKAMGAWLLYRKTRDAGLDHFVLYSSVSGLVGNPNQAAYAAANAVLDSLAVLCRTEGRTATCVAWGAIDEVGVVAGNQATRAHLQSLGVQAMPVRAALNGLERALRSERAWVGVIDVQWGRWMQSFPQTPWARLAELNDDNESVTKSHVLEQLRLEIAEMDAASKKERVLALVRKAAGRALGGGQARIDDESPLSRYGFDSLMAVEFQSILEQLSGISIPIIHFLSQGSLTDLTERVVDVLSCAAAPVVKVNVAASPAEDLRDYFLSRICVQPPYFDLFDFGRDGEWVEASVRPVAPSEDEADVVSCAEAARHLAIVGSCAVSLRSPFDGQVYYPIRRAYSTQMRADPADPQAPTGDVLELARVRSRCLSFDVAASSATAECDLLDLAGNVVFKLIVDYHVIPAEDFGRLFAAHAEPTHENLGYDPYGSWDTPVFRKRSTGVLTMEVPAVDPASCLGHFVGYPALPLSIMTRHAVRLIGAGVRSKLGPSAQITVLGGWVEARAFLFAHQSATITAQCSSSGGEAGDQVWACEVESEGTKVAVLELTVRATQRRVSEVRAVRPIKLTA
jgi:acyl transferase domain-containing protein/NADPH:quinone reductase-like Zn-dependent oxidoreductase/acyl carrier protein